VRAESEQPGLEHGVRGAESSPAVAAPAQAPPVAARQALALTRDEALRASLAEVAGAAGVSIAVVGTVAELSDELMRARTPVALIDAAALTVSAEEFIAGLAKQFPDLVLIAAGGSGDQAALARQVASSQVFRFLHKPASPQRVQIFLDSALRHHQQVSAAAPKPTAATVAALATTSGTVSATAAPAARKPPRMPIAPGRRTNLILAGVAAVIVAAVGLWIALRPAGNPAATTNPAPATTQDGAPGAAVQAGAGTGTIPAPPVEDPQRALDAMLGSIETALTEGRHDDAAELLESARPLAADSPRFKFLEAQLTRDRERATAEESRRVAALTRDQRLRELVNATKKRIGDGALIEPARESARAQFEAAAALAPESGEVRELRGALTAAMLVAAEKQIEAGQVDGARRLLDSAAALGVSSAGDSQLAKLRRRTDELQVKEAQRAAVAAAAAVAATTVTPPPEPVPAAVTPAAAPAETGGRGPTLAATSLKRVSGSDIAYPPTAERLGVSGWIDVEFTVATDGSVRDIDIIAAQPRGYFESGVQSGLKRWRYSPILRNGVPVEQRARLRLRFGFESK
jgi:TonB family protein